MKTTAVIRVFLGSPGDMNPERQIARAVVDELNSSIAHRFGLHVDILGWEDTVPGMGRPQSVINKDLEQCDVFVGMLWRKWGSPTGEYSSGFEEEFEICSSRFEREAKPEILMLFKSVSEDLLIDPGIELQRVLKFKEQRKAERKLLYHEFDDSPALEAVLRKFVTAQVFRFHEVLGDLAVSTNQREPTLSSSSRSQGVDRQDSFFLQKIASKLIEESPQLEPAEVARFRLISALLSKPENDKITLAEHDAHILFKERQNSTLGQNEIIGMIDCGLQHLKAGSLPLWYWLQIALLPWDEMLVLSSTSNTEVAVSAIVLITKLGIPLELKNVPRSTFIRIFFSDHSHEDVITAALAYLSEHGSTNDLATIEAELSKNRFRTRYSAEQARFGIMLRHDPITAVKRYLTEHSVFLSKEIAEKNLQHLGSCSTDELRAGLKHSDAQVRLAVLKELHSRDDLSDTDLQLAIADSDVGIREFAMHGLQRSGTIFDREKRKALLTSTRRAGLGLMFGGESEDNSAFDAYEKRRFAQLAKHDLEREIKASVLDWEPWFAFCERYFSSMKGDLRAAVDDGFKDMFDGELRRIASSDAELDDLRSRFESLKTYVCRDLTLKGAGVLARKFDKSDLQRVRKLFIQRDVTPDMITYLRKVGGKTDLALIASAKVPVTLRKGEDFSSHQVGTLISLMDSLAELLDLELADDLRAKLLAAASEESFKLLSNEQIFNLLSHEAPDVRAATGRKMAASFSKTRATQLLDHILSSEQYFYNAVYWLDIAVYAPQRLRRKLST